MNKKKQTKKGHIKYPKQQYKEKIKKQRAQYREKYMQEMSKELNPASRTLQDIMTLDDEEIKHRQFIEANYRDRAKERRQAGGLFGLTVNKEEESDDENIDLNQKDIPEITEQQQQQLEVQKGLDMKMYLEEMQQLEKNQNSLKKIKTNEFNQKTQQQLKLKLQQKGLLAQSIEKRIALNKQLLNSNLFNPSIHYEYEIDDIFDNSLPKSIIKKPKKIEEEDPKIIIKINQNIMNSIQESMQIISSGKPRKKQQQMKIMEIEEPKVNINFNQSDDDDAIFSENDDKQFDKIKLQLPSLAPYNDVSQTKELPEKKSSIFDNLTSNPKYSEHIDNDNIINNETQNQINIIQKNVLGQSKSRLEEKLALLNSDQYMECFPAQDPSLSELKQSGGLTANYQFKRFGGKSHKPGKVHKIDKLKENSKFQKVNQIMKDKQNKKQ